MKRKIGIIGGSGIEDPELFGGFEEKIVTTEFGEARCRIGEIAGNQVVFLSRHGEQHTLPPHLINNRANILALKSFGTEEIFATACVGSMNKDIEPGDFVVCDNILDFTKGRPSTFFDRETQERAIHVDFSYPFCERLRQTVIGCLKKLGYKYHKRGVYVCTEGPRFETAAEIKMFGMLGGDVVGMTAMPEAVLAHEAEMCYATIAFAANMGAGISNVPLGFNDIIEIMKSGDEKMKKLIELFIKSETASVTCDCQETLKEEGGFHLS